MIVMPGEGRMGLGSVLVRKAELVEKIAENQAVHIATYEEAMVGYRRVASEKILAAMTEFENGGDWKPPHLPLPEDHRKDYELVLAQLAMEVDEELLLTAQEFRQYALDEWSWKADFNRTTTGMGYVGDHGEYPGMK